MKVKIREAKRKAVIVEKEANGIAIAVEGMYN